MRPQTFVLKAAVALAALMLCSHAAPASGGAAAGATAAAAAGRQSARRLRMQYDAGDCSRHEMLYGQIHQDLMPWALKGIRPENLKVSHNFCRRVLALL